jgi:hypothetical protein
MHISGNSEHLYLFLLVFSVLAISFIIQPIGQDFNKLYIAAPSGHKLVLPPTCMSKTMFGISCPGCGLTRSFVAIAHGNFESALELNPFGPVFFLLLLLQLPYRVLKYLSLCTKELLKIDKAIDPIAWAILFGMMLSWGLRLYSNNIPH